MLPDDSRGLWLHPINQLRKDGFIMNNIKSTLQYLCILILLFSGVVSGQDYQIEITCTEDGCQVSHNVSPALAAANPYSYMYAPNIKKVYWTILLDMREEYVTKRDAKRRFKKMFALLNENKGSEKRPDFVLKEVIPLNLDEGESMFSYVRLNIEPEFYQEYDELENPDYCIGLIMLDSWVTSNGSASFGGPIAVEEHDGFNRQVMYINGALIKLGARHARNRKKIRQAGGSKVLERALQASVDGVPMHEMYHAFGFLHSTVQYDILSYTHNGVEYSYREEPEMWETMQLRDQLYYERDPENILNPTAQMWPENDAYLNVQYVDRGAPGGAGDFHLALTSLSVFSPEDVITLKVYTGHKRKGRKLLLNLVHTAKERGWDMGRFNNIVPVVWYFGGTKEEGKIVKAAVEKDGEPHTMEIPRKYEYYSGKKPIVEYETGLRLPVTFELTGYVAPGVKKKLKRKVWFFLPE